MGFDSPSTASFTQLALLKPLLLGLRHHGVNGLRTNRNNVAFGSGEVYATRLREPPRQAQASSGTLKTRSKHTNIVLPVRVSLAMGNLVEIKRLLEERQQALEQTYGRVGD